MLQFDKNNNFNTDKLSQYSDIIRFCGQCKQGKKLTNENWSPNVVDMFRKSLICLECEKLNKVKSKKFRIG